MKFHFKSSTDIGTGPMRRPNESSARPANRLKRISTRPSRKGDFPKWRFCVQIMPEADAEKTPYNPFDLTKVWSHGDYPLIDVGVMELNRNPENYFAQIEQAAFSPSNIVPGIGLSPDKVLQARIFSYADAHRHRLGTHYEALPVNAPKCPMHHYHKDGEMRFFPNNPNSDAYYEPNSFNGPVETPDLAEPPLEISGDVDRFDHREGNDDYGQPRALFHLFDDAQKSRLFSNIADAMQGVPDFIVERQLGHLRRWIPSTPQESVLPLAKDQTVVVATREALRWLSRHSTNQTSVATAIEQARNAFLPWHGQLPAISNVLRNALHLPDVSAHIGILFSPRPRIKWMAFGTPKRDDFASSGAFGSTSA